MKKCSKCWEYKSKVLFFRDKYSSNWYKSNCKSCELIRTIYPIDIIKWEIWKDVPWFEWKYQSSNIGRIKSLILNKILRPRLEKYWYYRFSMWWKMFLVHRIVYCSFNNISLHTKLSVCHKDDIPTNCNIDNLFLWTHQENIQDCARKWRMNKKLTLEQAKEIKYSNNSSNILSKQFNISPSLVTMIKNWKRWATQI